MPPMMSARGPRIVYASIRSIVIWGSTMARLRRLIRGRSGDAHIPVAIAGPDWESGGCAVRDLHLGL